MTLNAHLEAIALELRRALGDNIDRNRKSVVKMESLPEKPAVAQVQTSPAAEVPQKRSARRKQSQPEADVQRALERPMDKEDNVTNLNLWPYKSLQAFHVIYTAIDEETFEIQKRHPYVEFDAQGNKNTYDSTTDFKPNETSPVLDALLAGKTLPDGRPVTYGWVKVEAKGKKARKSAIKWVRRLRFTGSIDEKTGIRYRVIYGQFIDDGKLLMLPVDSGIRSLADLGMFISSDPKAAKRVRRMSASHQIMLEFSILHDRTREVPEGKLYTVRHEALNQEFTLLDFNMDLLSEQEEKLVDGMNVVKIFAKLFGKEYAHVKFTGLLDGLIKGFGHNYDHVEYDIVAYGTKHELILQGDKAYFGVVGLIHEHDDYMDIQTMINMGFYEEDLCPAEAKFWMDEIARVSFSENEDEIRDLLASLAHIAQDEKDIEDPGFKPKAAEDKWASVRAAELMLESKTMPVLFRRYFQNVFENSIDLLSGQIPMMRKFKRLSVAPNPLAILPNGMPCAAQDTLGDRICAWDLPEGWILLGRNPNTHSGEAILVFNVHLAELKKYRGAGLVFFGIAAGELLGKLNGGDMDDEVWATWDQAYIEKWKTMHYPVVDKIKFVDGNHKTTGNPYLNAQRQKYQPTTSEWTMFTLDEEMRRWVQSGVSLGTFINRIMLDVLLSGENRLAAIEYVKTLDQDDPKVQNALAYLEKKEDHILRREASNSDLVIDWLQMRKGDKEIVDSLLDHSAVILETPVFPMCYEERIPYERRNAKVKDYILVETKACRSLNALSVVRDQIIETARQTEWLLVRDIPAAVDLMFPSYEGLSDTARFLRTKWRELWEDLKEEYRRKEQKLPEEAYKWLANGHSEQHDIKPGDPDFSEERARKGIPQFRIVKREGLREFYFNDSEGTPLDRQIRLAVAVEIYRQVYSKNTEPVQGEDGFTRSFGDGVPDYILHDFMTACEQSGVTGLVMFAKLNGYAKDRLQAPVQVKATSNRIVRKSGGRELGSCFGIPDGSYTMSPKGVIVVAESAPELHSSYKVEETERLVSGVQQDLLEDEEVFEF